MRLDEASKTVKDLSEALPNLFEGVTSSSAGD